MLIVQCPKCKHLQKTNPKNIQTATKKCVYCGNSFKLVTEKGNAVVKRE